MSEAHEAAAPDPGALRRVMVIGNSGSGKSQFGRRLAKVLDLPLTDLDDEHWLAAEERWLIEGNYGREIDIRARRADLVVLFDLPRWLCTWRVIVRYFKIRLGRQVWRLPRNCQAGPDWEPVRDFPTFLLYIWPFRPAACRAPTIASPRPASSDSSSCAPLATPAPSTPRSPRRPTRPRCSAPTRSRLPTRWRASPRRAPPPRSRRGARGA